MLFDLDLVLPCRRRYCWVRPWWWSRRGWVQGHGVRLAARSGRCRWAVRSGCSAVSHSTWRGSPPSGSCSGSCSYRIHLLGTIHNSVIGSWSGSYKYRIQLGVLLRVLWYHNSVSGSCSGSYKFRISGSYSGSYSGSCNYRIHLLGPDQGPINIEFS